VLHKKNTPGIVPLPATIEPILPLFSKVRVIEDESPQRSERNTQKIKGPQMYTAIPSGARQRMVTKQAINVLTIQEEVSMDTMYTPQAIINKQAQVLPTMFKHFVSPIVHPVMRETISSYKKLMNDPASAEVWQTAFGKDFGRMAQGDNKTGQKETNALFVMTHDKIKHTIAARKNFTDMNRVVNYQAQKETAGGNLIKYDSNASVRTVDLGTTKLH
jgi:hypothetical protein